MNRKLSFLSAAVLVTAALFASATGCELIAAVDRSKIGQGGAGGGTGGQGGGGGPACTDPANDCDPTGTVCIVAKCDNAGECTTENAASGTDCTADGAAGKVCDGNGACVECVDPATDCPAPPNECVIATCTAGACGTMNVAVDTPTVGGQIDGDCKIQVCDGNGSTKQNDDDDPTNDMNDCTADTCTAGANVHTNIAGACAMGGTVCADPAGPKGGSCVECNDDNDCTAPNVCDPQFGTNTCVPFGCTDTVKNGNETGTDCGGPDCAACPNGQGCTGAVDCQSGFCNGTTCAACTVDSNCAANEFCGTATIGTQGVCTADLGDGSACSANSQCTNGHCVDGVCCDTTCTGSCQACSATKKGAGLDGVCGNIVSNADPDNECAGGDCNGAGACEAGNGTACTIASECASGFCTDGFCCNSTCAGTCQACNVAGNLGTCSPVPSNTDPANECAGGDCNGAGACEVADGTACTLGTQCISGNCVDSVCCNSACNTTCQACSAAKTGGANGVCGNVTVNTDPDNECAGGECNGAGACEAADGTACTLGSQCISGNCVDGFCCNSACNTTCQACSAAKTGGANGVCGNVTVNTDPDNECAGGECNGAGACEAADGTACTLGSQCISGNCVDGLCCNTACGGTCQACNVAGNLGTCTNVPSGQQDAVTCVGTNACDGAGVCKQQDGTACTLSSQCVNGNCVDGFCCNTACSGTCQACSATKKGSGANGVCGNIANNTNPDGEGVDTPHDCQKPVCNGAGALTSGNDPTDLPVSTTVCLINPACTGAPLTPSFSPAPTGTDCTSDGQLPKHVCGDTSNVLIAGTCVECNTVADCVGDAGACVNNVCQ